MKKKGKKKEGGGGEKKRFPSKPSDKATKKGGAHLDDVSWSTIFCLWSTDHLQFYREKETEGKDHVNPPVVYTALVFGFYWKREKTKRIGKKRGKKSRYCCCAMLKGPTLFVVLQVWEKVWKKKKKKTPEERKKRPRVSNPTAIKSSPFVLNQRAILSFSLSLSPFILMYLFFF